MGSHFRRPPLLRRDQVPAFIVERIARFGVAPKYDEFSNETSVSSSRLEELVGQLIERGIVRQRRNALPAKSA